MLQVVVVTAADGDQADTRVGHGVLVATAQRLLHRNILRGARFPVVGRHRRRRTVPSGRADHDGRGPVIDQRGGVRAVVPRRPPAAADRFVVGHGVFGRPGGVDGHRLDGPPLLLLLRQRRRRVRSAGKRVAADRRHDVRVQRFGRRTRVPVDAGRRTLARLGPGRGRRGASRVRVRPNVRHA